MEEITTRIPGGIREDKKGETTAWDPEAIARGLSPLEYEMIHASLHTCRVLKGQV